MVDILSQINLIHILIPYFFQTVIGVIITVTNSVSKFGMVGSVVSRKKGKTKREEETGRKEEREENNGTADRLAAKREMDRVYH
jgi:hypothetical protein